MNYSSVKNNFSEEYCSKGERRESNPRIMEPQPIALTTWPRSPAYHNYNIVYNSLFKKNIFYYLLL